VWVCVGVCGCAGVSMCVYVLAAQTGFKAVVGLQGVAVWQPGCEVGVCMCVCVCVQGYLCAPVVVSSTGSCFKQNDAATEKSAKFVRDHLCVRVRAHKNLPTLPLNSSLTNFTQFQPNLAAHTPCNTHTHTCLPLDYCPPSPLPE
jgi:hypothetical protein